MVPRSWTHLLATVLDRDVDTQTPVPDGWVGYASRLTGRPLPTEMSDGVEVAHEPWTEGADRVDASVIDTRRAVFPLHGLDPDDPRDWHVLTPGRDDRARAGGARRWTRRSRWTRPPRRSRTTRGTGRPTSSRPTAGSCTCARSCPATPTRSWPSTPGSPSGPATCATSARTHYISRADLERFTVVDHNARVALVALLGDEIIAVGRYEGTYGPDGTEIVGPAEVAFVVRDDHQSRGLGSILLEHLTAAARERGVRRFEAEVLAENSQMVRVFRDAGYQVSREFADGVLHLEFDIDPTERSMEVRDAREQRAEARSVHNVLHPRSVAVIGASTDPGEDRPRGAAAPAARQLRRPVYPVNPEARSVRGVRAYPAVTDIPDDVDLAVVAVPAAGMGERHGLLPGQGGQGARRAQRRVRRRRAGRA